MNAWNVGDSAQLSKTVTEKDIAGFAEITLDNNPVHFDPAYAAGTIFKGCIAHGVLSVGLISAVIGTQIPGPGAIYRAQSVQFHLPVRAGDTITATATITSFEDGVMELETIVTNQHGRKVVSGIAEIGYRPEKFKSAA
ncbi:MAG: MaoC family dehydratase [Cyanobacteria bacterium SZAS LIN-5]|nr:MaoC family dehydratase [Cyanobacteria bacterium SZAS LIN-5]